jgi:hypothetical protein
MGMRFAALGSSSGLLQGYAESHPQFEKQNGWGGLEERVIDVPGPVLGQKA